MPRMFALAISISLQKKQKKATFSSPYRTF
jgi:hypothetical protein